MARQVSQLKDVTEFNFLHKSYVPDLRTQGAQAFQEEGTVRHVLDLCNRIKTMQETADTITASCNKVTHRYGQYIGVLRFGIVQRFRTLYLELE